MTHHEGTKDTKEKALGVSQLVLVEVKATEKLTPLHRAQLLTYLRLTGHTRSASY